MGDISKMLNVVKTYTVYCLRATAFQGMNDAGFEITMHMLGHYNDSSARNYNRDCSTSQKKLLGDTLCRLNVQQKPNESRAQISRTATMTTPDFSNYYTCSVINAIVTYSVIWIYVQLNFLLPCLFNSKKIKTRCNTSIHKHGCGLS